MNTYKTDENNEEVLLSTNNDQVMMEWEKPYMEASINFLSPKGHVLEIGFGCGYSASQIMKHPIKSYTIIECDPTVIKKAHEWSENYPNIPINIVKGMWQNTLCKLPIFDEIYFDDYPLNLNEKSGKIEVLVSHKRFNIFLDLCIQNHTHVGSKIGMYLNHNSVPSFSSDSEPFIKLHMKTIDIKIPDSCKYRNVKEQKCTIPIIEKIKEYDYQYAQLWTYNKLQEVLQKKD